VQITAIHSPTGDDEVVNASPEQLKGCENHIVLLCATLGETDEDNPNSWVRHNVGDPDITSNVVLQFTLTEKDKKLWNIMDKATYDVVSVLAGSSSADVEYWDNSRDGSGSWQKGKPAQHDIRTPGIVHEASTLYMGELDLGGGCNVKRDFGPQPAVDASYRSYGCKNVYVTGSALFPTAGSWNPVLTICGYAQDLATKIVNNTL